MIVTKKPRPLTHIDRVLAYGDRMDRSLGQAHAAARRRTHFRFGALDVVIVEETNQPTKVYLENEGSDALVETTAADLAEAANAVLKLLANPPPMKRSPR